MSDRKEPRLADMVLVPYSGNRQDTAILLLGTAVELGYNRRVIRTTSRGFLAPQEVMDEIGDSAPKSRGKSRGKKPTPKVDFEATDTSEKE